MALRLNNLVRSSLLNGGILGSFGTASLKVYDGTQPGTGGATSGTSLLLVTIGGITWNAASNGTAVLSGSKTGTAGTTGTAAWARLTDGVSTTLMIDGACGTGASNDYVIDTLVITAATVVTLTSATLIQPAQ